MTLRTITVLLFMAAATSSADTEWTGKSHEGEDATSTHYYFFRAEGGILKRVRWVWNGGATNNPTATDYTIAPGKITVRHLEGTRKTLPGLIAGKDGDLKVTSEYTVSAKDVEKTLSAAKFENPLTKKQKHDLGNLKTLIIEHQKLKPAKAEQDGARQPATGPKSKSKGKEKLKPKSKLRSQ